MLFYGNATDNGGESTIISIILGRLIIAGLEVTEQIMVVLYMVLKAGTLSVTGSTFTGNCATNGAAIYYDKGGSLTVSGSTFTNNIASWDGGAIYNDVGGPFTVTQAISHLTTLLVVVLSTIAVL